MSTTTGQITFGIREVKLHDFRVDPHVANLEEKIETQNFRVQLALNGLLDLKDSQYVVQGTASLFEIKKNGMDEFLAELTAAVSFFIVDAKQTFQVNEDAVQVNIPDEFVRSTSSITVSTIRGMMAMALKDTIISNAVIPVLDPMTFVAAKG